MKQSERIVKKGNYYQFQSDQPSYNLSSISGSQSMPLGMTVGKGKKQQFQMKASLESVLKGSTTQNIAGSTINPGSSILGANPLSELVVTPLPNREQVLKGYGVPAGSKVVTEDYGLDGYQNQLEQLLKMAITDEQRKEIQKLLNQISSIKQCKQLPINPKPFRQQKGQQMKSKSSKYEVPKTVTLISQCNTEGLQSSLQRLQKIKHIQLSRLEHLVDILLKDPTPQIQSPTLPSLVSNPSSGSTEKMDPKTKQQLDSLYETLSQLKCLANLTQILHKLQTNETKNNQIYSILQKSESINETNVDILKEFQNDGLVLKELEQKFKANLDAVRAIVKKLGEL